MWMTATEYRYTKFSKKKHIFLWKVWTSMNWKCSSLVLIPDFSLVLINCTQLFSSLSSEQKLTDSRWKSCLCWPPVVQLVTLLQWWTWTLGHKGNRGHLITANHCQGWEGKQTEHSCSLGSFSFFFTYLLLCVLCLSLINVSIHLSQLLFGHSLVSVPGLFDHF